MMQSGLQRKSTHFLSEEYLAGKGPGKTKLVFAKGEQIFAQGDDCGPVFYVVEGIVKLTVLSPLGKVATIAFLNEGELLGEECLLKEQKFMSATATALTSTIVNRISNAEMHRVLRDELEMASFLVCYLLRKNGHLQSGLLDQLFNSSERRLARTLLILARFPDGGDTPKMVPHISQATLAAMVGCTRSRVNFFLNRFRKLGLIEYSDRIRVNPGLHQFLMTEGH